MRGVFLTAGLSAALVIAFVSGYAQSAPLVGSVVTKPATGALLSRVRAKRCIRLLASRMGDKLANSCNSCRVVNVTRTRPGGSVPANRTYTIPKRTITDLPFRGPGQTRVLSESACNDKASRRSAASQSGGKKCAQLYRPRSSNNLAILNTCLLCRTVVAERMDTRGNKRRQTFSIEGKSFVPLPPQGALRVRIVSDKSCR